MKNKTIRSLIALTLIAVMMLSGCRKEETPTQTPANITEAPQTTQSAADPADTADTASSGETAEPVDTASSGETAEPSDDTSAADYSYEKNPDGTLTLTGYHGNDELLYIPDSIDDAAVTAIGDSCFAGNIFVCKVHVPEGVTVLGNYAFECCSRLSKVYLPESLVRIGDGAFSGCCTLSIADLQDNIESIGKGAFLECTSLVSFIAPKSLRTIGDYAFANCLELVKVDMKDSVIEGLPDRLFFNCGDLSTVRLPETVTYIGKRAFCDAASIMYLYVPESVKSIGAYAFSGCSSLQNFSVTCDVIEPHTFNGCFGLSYVSFPETLTRISEGAFLNTVLNPDELDIPETAVIEEYAFGHLPGTEYSGDYEDPDSSVADAAPAADTTVDEIIAQAVAEGFRTVSADEFAGWASEYLDYNRDNALLDGALNPYISKYKGEIGYYFKAMTAVASGVESEIEAQKENFGDDFEDMYAMINHGLDTEMKRFRMKDDMLLYTGVYDFQLSTLAGTDTRPSLDEIKACVGKTFTDPCLTSTTTEAEVAFGFSDTLFIIYAPAANVNALGSVCMDSYMHSVENEILLCSGATYEILGAGVLQGILTDWDGTQTTENRDYVLLRLINE